MRDGRRVRDKFEFSLEPKQLALLFVLCLVIVILVFALGIIVGRGVQQPDVMPEEVAMVAQPPSAAEAPPVDAAPPAAEPAAKTAEPSPEKPAPKLKFFDRSGEAKKVADATPAKTEQKAPESAPTKAEPKPAESKTAEPKKTEAKKAEAKPESKKTAKASTQVAKLSPDKTYTIQVSAFQNRAQAEHMVANLKHKGYEAYIARASIPGKGVWFRVRIGEYGSRGDAQTTANKLKRKEGISTYVTLRQ